MIFLRLVFYIRFEILSCLHNFIASRRKLFSMENFFPGNVHKKLDYARYYILYNILGHSYFDSMPLVEVDHNI